MTKTVMWLGGPKHKTTAKQTLTSTTSACQWKRWDRKTETVFLLKQTYWVGLYKKKTNTNSLCVCAGVCVDLLHTPLFLSGFLLPLSQVLIPYAYMARTCHVFSPPLSVPLTHFLLFYSWISWISFSKTFRFRCKS